MSKVQINVIEAALVEYRALNEKRWWIQKRIVETYSLLV
jgi:hypothetical protein